MAGPDGALWFTEGSSNKIGRITTAGQLREFPLPHDGSYYPGGGSRGGRTGPSGSPWKAVGSDASPQVSSGAAAQVGRASSSAARLRCPKRSPGPPGCRDGRRRPRARAWGALPAGAGLGPGHPRRGRGAGHPRRPGRRAPAARGQVAVTRAPPTLTGRGAFVRPPTSRHRPMYYPLCIRVCAVSPLGTPREVRRVSVRTGQQGALMGLGVSNTPARPARPLVGPLSRLAHVMSLASGNGQPPANAPPRCYWPVRCPSNTAKGALAVYKRQFDRRHPRAHWGPWGWSTRPRRHRRIHIRRPRVRRGHGILAALFGKRRRPR